MKRLRIDDASPYRQLIGVGGVGSGIFFELEGDCTLGRNESRLGRLLNVRDYCKLHIVIHYVGTLLGASTDRGAFRVLPVAKVGDDAIGQRLIAEMRNVGIDTSQVTTTSGAPTLFSVCFQYPDGTGGNITSNNSAAAQLASPDMDGVAELFRSHGKQTIALAVPEVPLHIRRRFLQLASEGGAFRAGSFAAGEIRKAREQGIFELLDLVSLNENEAEELVGCKFQADAPGLYSAACQEVLRDWCPQLQVIVTAGELGAIGIGADSYRFCPAAAVAVASTAGAGDALLGGTLAALAAGVPFLGRADQNRRIHSEVDSALQFGVLLASCKCGSPHTIHPEASLDALIGFAHTVGMSFAPGLGDLFVDGVEVALAARQSNSDVQR